MATKTPCGACGKVHEIFVGGYCPALRAARMSDHRPREESALDYVDREKIARAYIEAIRGAALADLGRILMTDQAAALAAMTLLERIAARSVDDQVRRAAMDAFCG